MLAAYPDRFRTQDPVLPDGTLRDGVVTGIGSARQFC